MSSARGSLYISQKSFARAQARALNNAAALFLFSRRFYFAELKTVGGGALPRAKRINANLFSCIFSTALYHSQVQCEKSIKSI